MPEVCPLAHGRAQRPGVILGRPKREKIRQVEKPCRPPPRVRQVFLQPKQFRYLHFRRDGPADVTQNRIARAVDALRLAHGAVIHPYDHVLRRAPCRADGDRTIRLVQGNKRTRGIKAHAPDRRCGQTRLLKGRARRPGAGPPDVFA